MAQIVIIKGVEIEKYLDELAKMRLEYFKEFPYLYEGDWENERGNLSKLADDQHSILVLAFEGQEIAVVSTATPLKGEYVEVPEAFFNDLGFANEDLYYFGEIIVHQKFRGYGLATRIFKEQEKYAEDLGFKAICFLVVEREDNHPLKPEAYRENDVKWEHLGYHRTDKAIFFEWPTIQATGPAKNIKNKLVFWMKVISSMILAG
jgi:GNAT superfamily N-acetyltransferase